MSVAPNGQAYNQAVLSLPYTPNNAAAVVPSDSTTLANPASYLYIGGAGNVAVVTVNGQTVTFEAVPVGTVLPVACAKVKATGTSATNIVALW